MLPRIAYTQTADDLAALKDLADSAPVPAEVTPEPASTEEPDYRHRLLLNPIPGLPSEIKFLAPLPDGSSVRALFTLDGKLLALPLKLDRQSGEHRATFPTPFKSLDYQFQIMAPTESRLSQMYRTRPSCNQAVESEERFIGEQELVRNIRLLRNDAALLTNAIEQVQIILGKKQ